LWLEETDITLKQNCSRIREQFCFILFFTKEKNMDTQPIYDEVSRFAIQRDGYYVSWSLETARANKWWLSEIE
jgi:hypothetical protein